MKKTTVLIILIMLLLTVLLSGCIKINIDTGIDASLTAYLSYHIEMDVSELDPSYQNSLKNALNGLGWHYQEEKGFVVSLDTESDIYKLSMTRRINNNSIEEAFASLESLLTNEDITPFMAVDMAFQSSERQNRFKFGAETDISQIIRISNADELQPVLQEHLEEAMQTGEGTITLTLPASELKSASHQSNIQNDQAVLVVPLSFADKTDFELTGVINLLRDGTSGGTLEEIQQELIKYRNIAILACGAVIIILLIIFLIRSLFRMKRSSSVIEIDTEV